ncbi:MAG TPA: serine hydroxymethyltransferase [Actinobacteria bacterium]|nr:serine hydroxymethyltransferase [Actinomycetota bacterium]
MDHFTASLADADPELAAALEGELDRQRRQLELIASENYVSKATLEALGSPIVNKTVEGYPGRRYYGGAEFADLVETLAVDRAKRLFGAAHANVQPHSGSQANLACFLAFLEPGDRVLAMDLAAGGHLSHGAPVNVSGRVMEVHHYGVDPTTGRLDLDAVAEIAREVRPRLIVCGASAYPREIDFSGFRKIADEVGAVLLADIAHIAGLVAAGLHPDPIPAAHVVTTTTYKNLRGTRGGIVLTGDAELADRIDRAVFPGVQGSVILNAVAAKAVCLGEALRPEFTGWAQRVLANARALAEVLVDRGLGVVTEGTDTPLVLVDLSPLGLTGRDAQEALERVGIAVNKNPVPGDPRPPWIASGIRLGTSAGTTRGLGEAEFRRVGELVAEVLAAAAAGREVPRRVPAAVAELCDAFPIYPDQ